MASSQKPKKQISKIQLATLIIAILGPLLAFTGVKYQDVASFISTSLSPQADYTIESLATPEYVSTDFRYSLSVSAEHFVVTKIGMSSDSFYQGTPVRFSVCFEDKGKKAVEQPRVLILVTDTLYRIWGVWNKSATKEELARGWSFDYVFPPPDQKIIGSWSVIAQLYDDASPLPLLISYEFRLFMVTDTSSPLWIILFAMICTTIIAMLMAIATVLRIRTKRLKDEKKPNKKGASQIPQSGTHNALFYSNAQ